MISSVANPAIRSISRLRKARGRAREGAFLAEGHRAIAAALEANAPIHRLLRTEAGSRRHGGIVSRAESAGIPILTVTPTVMAHLSSLQTAPGLLAVARMPAPEGEPDLAGGVILDAVRDPASAGSILAAALAAGGRCALFVDGSVDPYDAKVVRAARGAHFGLDVRRASTAEALAAAERAGVRVVAFGGEAAPWDTDLRAPFVLAVPGEDGRHSPPVEAAATVRVAPPGRGPGMSVSAASAVVLADASRQRSSEGAMRENGPRMSAGGSTT